MVLADRQERLALGFEPLLAALALAIRAMPIPASERPPMRGTANGTLPHGPADAAGVAVTEPILSARKSLLRVPGRVGVGRGAGTGCEGVCLFPGLALGGVGRCPIAFDLCISKGTAHMCLVPICLWG